MALRPDLTSKQSFLFGVLPIFSLKNNSQFGFKSLSTRQQINTSTWLPGEEIKAKMMNTS